jgi:uncharacterized protein involved in response to NO
MGSPAGSAERKRSYRGPAILGFGFRPFFLSAALWAAFAMALWLAAFAGRLALPSRFDAIDWHAHELLFGYLPAVVAGFLLTAIPNWTGRLPVAGLPLAVLAGLWWLGRAAVLLSGHIPLLAAALLDSLFLLALLLVAGREISAGKNWRNLRVLVAVALLFLGNLLFHSEATAGSGVGGYGLRLGLSGGLLLIMLIGGRIVPSFTRNWLARRGADRLPAPFGRFDGLAVLASAAALALWILLPFGQVTGWSCFIAGALQLYRLFRWRPFLTVAEPLVWVLHLGYLFVPLGFFAAGIALMAPGTLPLSAALHLWTAGAIGLMTLAVMTRAALGHSGRPLAATPAIVLIYLLALGAAVLRFAFGLLPSALWLLTLSGLLWIGAFVLFLWVFVPLLAIRRA